MKLGRGVKLVIANNKEANFLLEKLAIICELG